MLKIFGILCLLLTAPFTLALAEPQTYENETLGVKLTGPQGWVKTTGPYKNEKAKKVLVSFHHTLNRRYSPFLMLTAEPAESRTPLDYAAIDMGVLKTDHKDLKILKEPTPLTINGNKGVNFTFEYILNEAGPVRYSIYVFMKDELLYILACGAKPQDFEDNSKSIESSVNTLMLR